MTHMIGVYNEIKVLLILVGLIMGGTMNLEANDTVKNVDVPIKSNIIFIRCGIF